MSVLDEILATKRDEVTVLRQPQTRDLLRRRALEAPATRPFGAALRRADGHLAVIAEIKRRSPSKGALALDLDPGPLAKAYEHGGARALSVLTDAPYFGGSVADLQVARESTELPVLRKDFTIDEVQVYEARAIGADAILLIAAAISDDALLADLHALADGLGLGVLVEAHDAGEIERALGAGARVVGVNSRNLATFAEDLGVAESLAAQLPPDVVAVAESAVRSADDAARMAAVGFDAVLVGEALVRASDPSNLLNELGAPFGRAAVRLMFVKICGITNEDDALLATVLGADALGFIFAPSTRQVHPEGVRDIVKRLPTDVLPVGVFRNERPEHVIEVGGRVGLHAVQLSGSEPLSEVRWIRERVRFVIQGFTAGDPALGAAANSPADVVLVDSPSPGSGKVFDWRLAEGAPGGVRLMIAGGLTPENVGEAIRLVRPWGVDVATGVEARPGQKDPRKLRRFIESARDSGDEGGDPYAALTEPLGEVDTVGGVNRPWDWQLDQ